MNNPPQRLTSLRRLLLTAGGWVRGMEPPFSHARCLCGRSPSLNFVSIRPALCTPCTASITRKWHDVFAFSVLDVRNVLSCHDYLPRGCPVLFLQHASATNTTLARPLQPYHTCSIHANQYCHKTLSLVSTATQLTTHNATDARAVLTRLVVASIFDWVSQ